MDTLPCRQQDSVTPDCDRQSTHLGLQAQAEQRPGCVKVFKSYQGNLIRKTPIAGEVVSALRMAPVTPHREAELEDRSRSRPQVRSAISVPGVAASPVEST